MTKIAMLGRLQQWSIELTEFDIKYSPQPTINGQVLAYFIVRLTFPKQIMLE